MIMSKIKKTPYFEKKPSSLRYYQKGVNTDLNLDNWSLKVFLPNEIKPIEIDFEELKGIAPITENRRVVCVCNWSIRCTWTGVLLSDILAYAGVDFQHC